MKQICLAIAALWGLSACSWNSDAIPDADSQTTRQVSGGEIIGFHDTEIGADIWLGVPYAEPPINDLRWTAPQPHSGWDETRQTLMHHDRCAQVANALAAASMGVKEGSIVGSEDCLIADIYAPRDSEVEGPLPVMVWIHGGANLWGTTTDYSGAQMAVDQNVIIVMLQYRLGPFGYFAHPDIIAEDHGANFAHLDLVRGLEWVRDNAEAFGGDPDNVTVFGQSAGGRNTAVILQSPLTEGLFHRAIIQSGFFFSSSLEEAEASAQFLADGLEAQTAEALRAATPDEIFQVFTDAGDLMETPRVIADGVTIPLEGLSASFDDPDGFHRVPVITGTTLDEMKLFNAFNTDLSRRYFSLYITTPDPDLYNAVSEYQARVWRLGSVDEFAEQLNAAGHDDVWAYRFDWDEGGRILGMDMGHLFGAAHAFEIPFVMNNFNVYGPAGPIIFDRKGREGRERLSAQMGVYWGEMARVGDPGGIPDLTWQRWEQDGKIIRFDTEADGGLEIMTGRESETAILTDLLNDDRVAPEMKCRVLSEGLTFWRPDLLEHSIADTLCLDQ